MTLFALGLNHTTAPLPVRERVVFHVEKLFDALGELTRGKSVAEAAILSTCNRTELYLSAEQPQAAAQWLAEYHRMQPGELGQYLYTLPQDRAVRHTFRVAAGMDSMVLGEPQILGQMKEAVRAAQAAGTLGTVLHKLFQRTFAVAKEVRSNTQLGANSVSMAAAAVKLAARIFPSLKDQAVLFIGAGEMVELCATHFAAQAPARLTVANRTLERGQSLAHRFNGRAIELRALPEQLQEHDIVVSCTASSLPILGKGLVERARCARASAGRCSWWTWRCRATSRPRWASWTTCSSTRWTTWKASCAATWTRAAPRSSRPRRSSRRRWASSCTGCARAPRCR